MQPYTVGYTSALFSSALERDNLEHTGGRREVSNSDALLNASSAAYKIKHIYSRALVHFTAWRIVCGCLAGGIWVSFGKSLLRRLPAETRPPGHLSWRRRSQRTQPPTGLPVGGLNLHAFFDTFCSGNTYICRRKFDGVNLGKLHLFIFFMSPPPPPPLCEGKENNNNNNNKTPACELFKYSAGTFRRARIKKCRAIFTVFMRIVSTRA